MLRGGDVDEFLANDVRPLDGGARRWRHQPCDFACQSAFPGARLAPDRDQRWQLRLEEPQCLDGALSVRRLFAGNLAAISAQS
jgi:hypothetical protein